MLNQTYLRQPRGSGTGYTLKMDTPPALVGRTNPRTGKPYGRTIHEGLRTRDLRQATAKRDLLIGQIRAEAIRAVGDLDGDAEALRWAEERAQAERLASEREEEDERTGETRLFRDTTFMEVIESRAEQIERRKGLKAAGRFFDVASGAATPFKLAAERYAEASKQLSTSTRNNLKTEVKRFLAFAGETATLQEVDRNMVHRYLCVHLPGITSPKAPNGLGKASIQRSQTLLAGIWRWARRTGLLPYESVSPWQDQPLTLPDDRPARPQEDQGKIYSPEQWRTLMAATSVGERLGDALRIAIMTGCRLGEIIELSAGDVEDDATGFFVRKGKTKNARRYVPLFGQARAAVRRRASSGGPLFPETAVRASTGKRTGAVTQEFTRLRRKALGRATDGDLDFHSTRHTWRTMARRTDVPDRTVLELGGWAGQSTTDRPYDHGLDRDGYRAAAWKIVSKMVEAGYFDLPEDGETAVG